MKRHNKEVDMEERNSTRWLKQINSALNSKKDDNYWGINLLDVSEEIFVSLVLKYAVEDSDDVS